VLKQNNQRDSADKLDLRLAEAKSFVRLKDRADKYITELRTYRIDDAAMPNIVVLPLYKLEMRNAPATDKSLKYITQIHSLVELELTGMKLNIADCRELLSLPRLEFLALNHCGLNDDCIKVLCQRRLFTNLQLSGNKGITDASVQDIAAAQLPLAALNLESTSISDSSISLMTRLNDLQELNLTDTKVGDHSLPYLAQMRSLRWLDLNHTRITSAGLAGFHPVKLLRIGLHGCDVSPTAVSKFKQNNPDCAVYLEPPPTIAPDAEAPL
jgi:hypothetical protein